MLTRLRLARGSEHVKVLVGHAFVLRLREHSQHACDGGSRARVGTLPLVPLEGGRDRPAWMYDHDVGMAAAEQDDGDGVLSCGPVSS
jgi:hypothetical protein